MPKLAEILNARFPIINLQDKLAIYFVDSRGRKKRVCWLSKEFKGQELVIAYLPKKCPYFNVDNQALSYEQVEGSVLEILKFMQSTGIDFKKITDTTGFEVVYLLQGKTKKLDGSLRHGQLIDNLLKLPNYPYNMSLAFFRPSIEFKSATEIKEVKQDVSVDKGSAQEEKGAAMKYHQMCTFIDSESFHYVHEYLSQRINPNPPPSYKGKLGPPLAMVCEKKDSAGSIECLVNLLRSGANMNAVDTHGYSVLERAAQAYEDNTIAIFILLHEGATVTKRCVDLAKTALEMATNKKLDIKLLKERLALLVSFFEKKEESAEFKLVLNQPKTKEALMQVKVSNVILNHLKNWLYCPLFGIAERIAILDRSIFAMFIDALNRYADKTHILTVTKINLMVTCAKRAATNKDSFLNDLALIDRSNESQLFLADQSGLDLATIIENDPKLTVQQCWILATCRKFGLRVELADLRALQLVSAELEQNLFGELFTRSESRSGLEGTHLSQFIAKLTRPIADTRISQYGPMVLALIGKYFLREMSFNLNRAYDPLMDRVFKEIGHCFINAILKKSFTIDDEILQFHIQRNFRLKGNNSCVFYNFLLPGTLLLPDALQNVKNKDLQTVKDTLLCNLKNLTEDRIIRVFDRATNTIMLLNERLAGIDPKQSIFQPAAHTDLYSAAEVLYRQEKLHKNIREDLAKSAHVMNPFRYS